MMMRVLELFNKWLNDNGNKPKSFCKAYDQGSVSFAYPSHMVFRFFILLSSLTYNGTKHQLMYKQWKKYFINCYLCNTKI